MLTITIPASDLFDEVQELFVTLPEVTLDLEHSLFSLSKWESKWEIPFLDDNKTDEQTMDYVRCMTVSQEPDPQVYKRLSESNIEQVTNYINAKMTASWYTDRQPPTSRREVITAELIYHWMVSLTIPFECQHWHLNRLLMLVRVCNEKNSPAKKATPPTRDSLAERRALNAARKAKHNTSG